MRWHAETYADCAVAPSLRTLYRYAGRQLPTWFIQPLLLDQAHLPKLPMLMVLEEQAELLLALKRRLALALAREQQTGVLYEDSEAAASLLDKVLMNHFKVLQEHGLAPRLAANAEDAPAPTGGGLAMLVERFIALPADQFVQALDRLYPPPGASGPGPRVIEVLPAKPNGEST